ncbi:hypothetical protein [Aestuariivita sp.]|jgi:hypothetical protein|uniref:hypothetical protein n=1 Tax=Aestuariivita sp. TaxID=1872407 RepID=UPI0021706C04|nr:hypothetical protein [Aestuariivita sp.]MCE8005575.1 hypothetical protein [Aestuariivita sp.]
MTFVMAGLAAIVAWILPLRWGVLGFLGAALGLFVVHFAALSAMGFEGEPLSESLLLFGGSWVAYFGFNAQVAYRAFALSALVLGAVVVWRMGRVSRA